MNDLFNGLVNEVYLRNVLRQFIFNELKKFVFLFFANLILTFLHPAEQMQSHGIKKEI